MSDREAVIELSVEFLVRHGVRPESARKRAAESVQRIERDFGQVGLRRIVETFGDVLGAVEVTVESVRRSDE